MNENSATSGELSRLRTVTEGDLTIITFPKGQMDGVALRQLYETIAALTDRHSIKVMVDLAGVPMVSSGGMGMLITVKKKLMHVGGQLHVVAPDPMVLQSFKLMNLHLVLSLFSSVEEAVARFKP